MANSKRNERVKKPKEKKKCLHCKTEFQPVSNVQKYCSRACCQAAVEERRKESYSTLMVEENPLNLRRLSKAEEISLGRTADILQATVIDYGMPAALVPREKRGVKFMGQWMPLFKEHKSEPRRSDVPHTTDTETLLRWIFKEGEYAEDKSKQSGTDGGVDRKGRVGEVCA